MDVLATEFIRKCARIILQILLVALFVIIFGIPSIRKYQKEEVQF